MTDDITVRIADILTGHMIRTDINHPSFRRCRCGYHGTAEHSDLEELIEWRQHVAEQIVQQLGLEQEYEKYDEDGDPITPYMRWCTTWELVDKPVDKSTTRGPWHHLRAMMRRGGLD